MSMPVGRWRLAQETGGVVLTHRETWSLNLDQSALADFIDLNFGSQSPGEAQKIEESVHFATSEN